MKRLCSCLATLCYCHSVPAHLKFCPIAEYDIAQVSRTFCTLHVVGEVNPEIAHVGVLTLSTMPDYFVVLFQQRYGC